MGCTHLPLAKKVKLVIKFEVSFCRLLSKCGRVPDFVVELAKSFYLRERKRNVIKSLACQIVIICLRSSEGSRKYSLSIFRMAERSDERLRWLKKKKLKS